MSNINSNQTDYSPHTDGFSLNYRQKAIISSEKDALFYNLSQKHCGLAIIFNQEKFNDSNLKTRRGTKTDVKNLNDVLSNLGFIVEVYHDLDLVSLLNVLKTTSYRDFSEIGSLCIFILTHGENGVLYTKDAKCSPEDIWERFTANKCLSLAGKPKMFFFLACRGGEQDYGVKLYKNQTDSLEKENSYVIPRTADILIVYSTVEGYVSYREDPNGTWFVQAFCEELSKRYKEYDLLTILTFVSQRVAFHNDKLKQLPVIISMLTRLVSFNVK